MPAGVLGLEAIDDVEKEDYENVIVPAIEKAIAVRSHGRTRRLPRRKTRTGSEPASGLASSRALGRALVDRAEGVALPGSSEGTLGLVDVMVVSCSVGFVASSGGGRSLGDSHHHADADAASDATTATPRRSGRRGDHHAPGTGCHPPTV